MSKRFPVVEVFGPTVQGEGPDAGRPCWFVRLGGCDFRCSWCDSMHAVDPARVREAERLTARDILERLLALGMAEHAPTERYVVLSGGNPALHTDGAEIVDLLHANGCIVAVETQGSVWRPWLSDVDRLVISPKPPSSGMATERHATQFARFLHKAWTWDRMHPEGRCSVALKVVAADRRDYEWARDLHAVYPSVPFYLSACTPVDPALSEDDVIYRVRSRYRFLCEDVAHDPAMADVRVLPQLHVIAWGTRQGV